MANFSTPDSQEFNRHLHLSTERRHSCNFSESLEIEKCGSWIKDNGFKNICLQFPDDLLHYASQISTKLREATGQNICILADTSYSSCCVDCVAAAHIDADSIIHYGHSCLSPHVGIPVLYIFEKIPLDVTAFSTSVMETVVGRTCVIFYDTAYHYKVRELQETFSSCPSIEVSTFSIDDEKGDKQAVCGRIFSCEKPEVAIFIGSECMAAINISLFLPEAELHIYEDGKMKKFSPPTSKTMMKRYRLIEEIKDAAVIGILIATLSVTNYLSALSRVKDLCKKSGKKCYTIAVGKPNVAKLANFPEIDVYVVISCLENPLLLDSKEYYKPIASLLEVEIALGGRNWTPQFTLDFRQLLPGGSLYNEEEISNIGNEETSDVSLLTGRLRVSHQVSDGAVSDGTAIATRHAGTIAEHGTTDFFATRSWKGLEQNIGQTKVELAQEGRSGIPISYDDEGT